MGFKGFKPFKPILIAVTWVPVIFTFSQHVYQPYFITGMSMTPTFNPGTESLINDIALVKKFGLKNKNNLTRGDIIIFRSPLDPEKILTKRIIGMQGDSINCLPKYPKPTTTIPRNHYWVEGDNEFHSIDSNDFGPISQALVVGKVISIMWPISRIGYNFKVGGRDNAVIKKI